MTKIIPNESFVIIFKQYQKFTPLLKFLKYTKRTTVGNIEPSNDDRVNKEKERTT